MRKTTKKDRTFAPNRPKVVHTCSAGCTVSQSGDRAVWLRNEKLFALRQLNTEAACATREALLFTLSLSIKQQTQRFFFAPARPFISRDLADANQNKKQDFPKLQHASPTAAKKEYSFVDAL